MNTESTTLAQRRGVGITKCAYGKPPARQINGIPLPDESGYIKKRVKFQEKGIRTQETVHKVLKST